MTPASPPVLCGGQADAAVQDDWHHRRCLRPTAALADAAGTPPHDWDKSGNRQLRRIVKEFRRERVSWEQAG